MVKIEREQEGIQNRTMGIPEKIKTRSDLTDCVLHCDNFIGEERDGCFSGPSCSKHH